METSWIAQGIQLVTHIQANFSFPRDDSGPPSAGEHGHYIQTGLKIPAFNI